MRILLAEDDHLIGSAIEQRLKEEAHALDWVKDGESALSAINNLDNSTGYDVLLLDIGLPRKDGFHVLQQ